MATCQTNTNSDWSAKEFRKRNEKKLNSSKLFSLRNFFTRTLCEMSLRMPVTYFARTFSHFAVFFLIGNWLLKVKTCFRKAMLIIYLNLKCVEKIMAALVVPCVF